MTVSNHSKKVIDEVISEVRAIKRNISESHGNDIDRLLASLIAQERISGTTKAEQCGPEHLSHTPESKSEDDAKPEFESHPEDSPP